MSKRKKRRTRAPDEDAATGETPAAEKKSQSDHAASCSANALTVHRVVLVIAATLWFGWFGFLLYVALRRG